MSYWKDALLGVNEYFSANKLIAVCFAILLYEYFVHRKLSGFLKYGLCTIVVVLCPLTTVVILIYQSPVYDAGFIWTLIPVISLCAYAAVRFLWDMLPNMEKQRKCRYAVGICAVLGILFLLGNRGQIQRVTMEDAAERCGYRQIAEQLGEEAVLWGPRDLMQWARSRNGSVKLVYGLDMWDSMAAAYDGDAYQPELIAAYEWMQSVEAFAYQLEITTDVILPVPQEIADNMQSAFAAVEAVGGNTIVLPVNVYQQLVEQISIEYEMQDVAEYALLRGKN